MNCDNYIQETAAHMRRVLSGVEPGHDWWHTERVWNNAKLIQAREGGDGRIVELAALLHDVADYKFHGGDEELGAVRAAEWLTSLGLNHDSIQHVCSIIRGLNFKGSAESESALSLEHAVVQDADRLDALGAIGIARCFSFGGHFGREIVNPEIPPCQAMTREQYKAGRSPSINHFYEKLLLLRDRMLTKTGKALAEGRHEFMLAYLKQFFAETASGEFSAGPDGNRR